MNAISQLHGDLMRSSSFNKQDLIACADGTLFGPNNARLPLPPMLMMDRVLHISDEGGAHGKGEMIAELDIHPDLWFFACHFATDPVMPGCLGLDAMWQMLGFYLGWRGNAGRGRALGVGEGQIYRSGAAASQDRAVSSIVQTCH